MFLFCEDANNLFFVKQKNHASKMIVFLLRRKTMLRFEEAVTLSPCFSLPFFQKGKEKI
jgi:hypothetical protein